MNFCPITVQLVCRQNTCVTQNPLAEKTQFTPSKFQKFCFSLIFKNSLEMIDVGEYSLYFAGSWHHYHMLYCSHKDTAVSLVSLKICSSDSEGRESTVVVLRLQGAGGCSCTVLHLHLIPCSKWNCVQTIELVCIKLLKIWSPNWMSTWRISMDQRLFEQKHCSAWLQHCKQPVDSRHFQWESPWLCTWSHHPWQYQIQH